MCGGEVLADVRGVRQGNRAGSTESLASVRPQIITRASPRAAAPTPGSGTWRGRSWQTMPILVVALSVSSDGAAQSRDYGPITLELPASTSAMAMGGAFQLTGGRSDAIFYNPALLAIATGAGLDFQTFDSKSSALAVSAAVEWWRGVVGVGLQTLSYSTDARNAREVLGEISLLSRGTLGAAELVATAGYALEMAGVEWGIGVKAVEQRLGGAQDLAVGADVGASLQVGEIRLGLAAQNLGSELELGGASVDLARRVTLGASAQRWEVGPLDLGASAALSREADGTLVPALGAEVAWWPVVGRTFMGWVGVRRSEDGLADEVTFGAGFHGDALALEYAYQGFELHGAAHRFGISWR